MKLERFYQLRDRLRDAHRITAQVWVRDQPAGPHFPQVAPLPPTVEQEPACSLPFVRVQAEHALPGSPLRPPAYRLKLTSPEVHAFRHKAPHGSRICLQSEFNSWGADGKLALEPDREGVHRASIVSSLSYESSSYRYLQDDRPALDQCRSGLSFLPGIGVCSRLDLDHGGYLSLPMEVSHPTNPMPEPEEESPPPYSTAPSAQTPDWVLTEWPDWLHPLPEQTLPSQGPGRLQFKLDLSGWKGRAQQYRLVLRPSADTAEPLECILWLEPERAGPPIWCPRSQVSPLQGLFSQGQKIPLQIPVRFHGQGDLRVRVVGAGVHYDRQLRVDGEQSRNGVLEISLDTKALPARLGQQVRLHLQTDSKIPNQRSHQVTINLDLTRLDTFPLFRLDWRGSPWGGRLEKRVEFRRRDTGEEAREVQVNIPPLLAGCLSAETSFEAEHEIVFYLDSAQLAEGELLQGEVEVVARFDHEVSLQGFLPVLASAHTTQASLQVSKFLRPSGPVVELCFHNRGVHPLHLYELFWRKNHFRYASDPLAPITTPCMTAEPGQKLRLLFQPVLAPRCLLPRWVRDRLKIQSNCSESPVIKRRLMLFLPPLLLRPFVYWISRKPKAEM